MSKQLILDDYLMGRDILFPEEFDIELRCNAENLIKRVNNLLHDLKIDCPRVTSGYRPLSINIRSGGAKRSLHMTCRAVDLADVDGSLKKAILTRPSLLDEYGLWMEHGDSTPGWCHLDVGIRLHRPVKVFKP